MEVTSFSLTMTAVENTQHAGIVTAGQQSETKISYRAPDEFRKETAVIAGSARAGIMTQLSNDHEQYIWAAGSQQMTQLQGPGLKNDVYAGKTSGWPFGATDLRSLIAQDSPFADAKLIGEAEVVGRPAYVVEIPAALCPGGPGAESSEGVQTLWIDKETLFVLKQERHSPDGQLLSSTEVTAIQYNPQLDDGVFEPPAGGHGISTRDLGAGVSANLYQMSGAPDPGFGALFLVSTGTTAMPGVSFGCAAREPATAGPFLPIGARTVVSVPGASTRIYVPATPSTTTAPAASAAVGP
jgi:outer membrane lipoprotein-sorting protein